MQYGTSECAAGGDGGDGGVGGVGRGRRGSRSSRGSRDSRVVHSGHVVQHVDILISTGSRRGL